MTSKERVIRTLRFEQPDKIPVNLWCLPAAKLKYGEALEKIISESKIDILSAPFNDPTEDPRHFQVGTLPHGCVVIFKKTHELLVFM